MLKRVFAFILVAAAFLFALIKCLLSLASMASTLEFLRSHSPSFLRALRKLRSQAVVLVAGIVIGLSFHRIVPRTSEDHANPEVRVVKPSVGNNESTCLKPSQAKPSVLVVKPSASPFRAWRQYAGEMFSFEQEMERSSPPQILSTTSPEVTNRSMEMCNEHNHQAVIRFLSRFSVPVADIIRDARDRGLDASPLEGHMAELNSIPMMRLVSADVMSLANQLQEIKTAHSSRLRKHQGLPAA